MTQSLYSLTCQKDLKAKIKETFLNMKDDKDGKEAMALWGIRAMKKLLILPMTRSETTRKSSRIKHQ